VYTSGAGQRDRSRKRRGITPDTALRLARFFGGDAQSWMNLQIVYDLKLAEKKAAKIIAKEVPTLAQLAAADGRFCACGVLRLRCRDRHSFRCWFCWCSLPFACGRFTL
jgi:hypothetical protein